MASAPRPRRTRPGPAPTPTQPASIIWRPTREYVEGSRLWRFMRHHGLQSYDHLLQRASADPEWYWDAVAKDLGLEWFVPYERVLDLSEGPPWARWFVGARYNFAHDAVDKHASSPRRGQTALIWEGEEGALRTLTYGDLHFEANRFANALRAAGIDRGDRVGIFMPMLPETVVAVLACAKVGAIFIPIFSGYGPQAVASRLADAEAKALVTADGYYRRRSIVEMKETADEALPESVQTVFVVRRVGREIPWREGRDVWWHETVSGQAGTFATEQTDADAPYMIIYTSGTTGRPKGALHVHGGFPIKAVSDMAYCFDVQERDVVHWVTDIGWMMGPWVIGGTLMLGATLFLYDGAIDAPRPDRLWDMVERHRVSVFCFSPTGVRSLMAQGEHWVRGHDLSSVRILGSSGEPWNPGPYRWFFENVGGGRCPVINYSGGTEIAGGIVGCTPITPLKPCSFAGPIPGMDAEVFDEQGRPVRGAVGELVLRRPWPGMTRGFWRDPERYLDTYWSRWPGVWVHGDWVEIDEDGFWFIHGRSDDTIKVAGKRVGPAEVEGAAVAHPAVVEAAAIGVRDELRGEAVALFCVLGPGHAPSDGLRDEIATTVAAALGKALRPRVVRFVSELPKTRNAKVLRRLVRAKFLGTPVGDTSSLENPSSLDEIARAA